MSEGSEGAPAELLCRAGLPTTLAGQLAERLGDVPAEQLRADPWVLLTVAAARPEQADSLARTLLGAAARPDDPRRARAIVAWLLARAGRDGHTLLPVQTVHAVLAGYGFEAPTAVAAAVEADLVVPAVLSGRAGGERAVLGLAGLAAAERRLAADLVRLGAAPSLGGAGARGAAGAGPDWTGAPEAGRGVVLHLTGPGEGPPSSGPTGDGPPSSGTTASTAGAGATAGQHPAARPEATPGGQPTVVVREAHLLGVEAAAALLAGVPEGGRLVLAGDPAELPSIAPGNVFADLLGAGRFPVTPAPGSGPAPDAAGPEVARLDAAGPHRARPEAVPTAGTIGALAAAVRAGVLPAVHCRDREVVVVPATGADEAVHRVLQLVTDSIPRAFGLAAEQIQVITPARHGSCGSRVLNRILKQRLNPGPGRAGGFDPGDRVILAAPAIPAVPATAGPPAAATAPPVVAATPGLIEEVRPDALTVRLADHHVVVVPRAHWSALAHGWAVTVRQAQGNRWPAVVLVLPGERAGLLSRALVYTALNRAQAHLSVIDAAGPALARAVTSVAGRGRLTRLPDLLSAVTCG